MSTLQNVIKSKATRDIAPPKVRAKTGGLYRSMWDEFPMETDSKAEKLDESCVSISGYQSQTSNQ